MADEGCKIAICARNEERLKKVCNEIEKKEVTCNFISADVTKDEDINKILFFGPYDILINNVGGGGRWGTENYEEFKEWEEVYLKNAGAARKFTMNCLPYMKKQKWGRVITIASIYGKEKGGRPWFNMAKAAEISLMKNLAGRYKGVTFNTIAPGHIDIGTKDYKGEGKPEDVAGIAVFLCSDRAKYINGACITVDGGESISF